MKGRTIITASAALPALCAAGWVLAGPAMAFVFSPLMKQGFKAQIFTIMGGFSLRCAMTLIVIAALVHPFASWLSLRRFDPGGPKAFRLLLMNVFFYGSAVAFVRWILPALLMTLMPAGVDLSVVSAGEVMKLIFVWLAAALSVDVFALYFISRNAAVKGPEAEAQSSS